MTGSASIGGDEGELLQELNKVSLKRAKEEAKRQKEPQTNPNMNAYNQPNPQFNPMMGNQPTGGRAPSMMNNPPNTGGRNVRPYGK